MATPEPVLRIQRHLLCCGMTYTLPRAVREGEDYAAQTAWQANEVEAWAKNHRMTCRALKATDDDTE